MFLVCLLVIHVSMILVDYFLENKKYG